MDKDDQLFLRSIRNSLFILANMEDGHPRNVHMKGMLEMIRVSMDGHPPGCDNFGCQDTCPIFQDDQEVFELIKGTRPKTEEVSEGRDISPEERTEAVREKLREVVAERDDALHNRCADDLRAEGWTVAVHNDYRQSGELHTFWLLTHPNGKWVKGEGRTDAEALNYIRAKLNWTGCECGAPRMDLCSCPSGRDVSPP